MKRHLDMLFAAFLSFFFCFLPFSLVQASELNTPVMQVMSEEQDCLWADCQVSGESEILEQVCLTPNNLGAGNNFCGPTYLVQASGLSTSATRVINEEEARSVSVNSLIEPKSLEQACQTQNIEAVKLLILKGADINQKNIIGRTPLYIAVKNGDASIVSELLKNNARLEVQDPYGRTPLHISVLKNNLSIFLLLINAGANVRATASDGWTLLHAWAQVSRNLRILDTLVEKDPSLISMKDKQGNTPFLIACSHDKPEAALLLLNKGASLLDENKEGQIWTHRVALSNANPKIFIEDVLKIFVSDRDKKNALNRKTKGDQTVLHFVCRFCRCKEQENIDFLLENGALLEAKDQEGRTPFHYACMTGNKVIVQYLLSKKNDLINQISGKGLTPLDYALGSERFETILFLVERGALCIEQIIAPGPPSFLHVLARYASCISILEKFLEYHKRSHFIYLKINGKTVNSENTPLHCAALSRNIEAYNLLVAYGAGTKVRNKNGLIPEDLFFASLS